MNIAIFLISGIGKRVGHSNIPKQFITINDKPLFSYGLDVFLKNNNIDRVIVVTHKDWNDWTIKYIKESYRNDLTKIDVIVGGKTRNESIFKAYQYLKNSYQYHDDDIIITHDGVRIFVNQEIINNSIEYAINNNAIINTAIKMNDSLCVSADGVKINSIPSREAIYQSQTPQSAKYSIFKEVYNDLLYYDEYDLENGDFCKLGLTKNIPIFLINGSIQNLKITTDDDLNFAKIIIEKNLQ